MQFSDSSTNADDVTDKRLNINEKIRGTCENSQNVENVSDESSMSIEPILQVPVSDERNIGDSSSSSSDENDNDMVLLPSSM